MSLLDSLERIIITAMVGSPRICTRAKYYLEEHVNESRKVGGYLSGDVIMYYAACLCELQERKYGLDDNGLPDFKIFQGIANQLKLRTFRRMSSDSFELEAHMKKALVKLWGRCKRYSREAVGWEEIYFTSHLVEE